MPSSDDSFQLGINNAPKNADPGKKRYTQNGNALVQTDENGNQILFGEQLIRLLEDTDGAGPVVGDNRNVVEMDSTDPHDFLMGLDAATEPWETTVMQVNTGQITLKSVAGVKINLVDNETLPVIGGAGQGVFTIKRKKDTANEYYAFGAF